MGRDDRSKWVGPCVPAVQHMLLVEHCKTATKGDVKHWRDEILAFRKLMGDAVDDAHVLLGEYERNPTKAWAAGRRKAVDRLAEYAAEAAGLQNGRKFRRIIRAGLPEECHYLAEHVAAYDPHVGKEPRKDVWPPGVAKVFNRVLGTNYEIFPGPSHTQHWERPGPR